MGETIVRRRNVIRRDAMSRNVIQCLEANAGPWHYSPGWRTAANSIDALTRHTLETHGPLGTLIAGLGLGAFYTALLWVNLLLGHMLTPLFLIPLTWLQDMVLGRRKKT